jgi:hypothetical protein
LQLLLSAGKESALALGKFLGACPFQLQLLSSALIKKVLLGEGRSRASRRPRRRQWERVTRRKGCARVRLRRTLALGWVGFYRRRRGLWHRGLDCEAASPRLRWPWSARAWSRWPLGCWSPPVWPSAAGCLAWAVAQPGHYRSLVLTQLASISAIPPAEWPAFCAPVLCCQVPRSRLTASVLTLPIVRLY